MCQTAQESLAPPNLLVLHHSGGRRPHADRVVVKLAVITCSSVEHVSLSHPSSVENVQTSREQRDASMRRSVNLPSLHVVLLLIHF